MLIATFISDELHCNYHTPKSHTVACCKY